MHSVALGNAWSRRLPIGLPQISQTPYVPSSIRRSARSVWSSMSRLFAANDISCSRSNVLVPASAWSSPAPSPESRSRSARSPSAAVISSRRRSTSPWGSGGRAGPSLELGADGGQLLGRPGRLVLTHDQPRRCLHRRLRSHLYRRRRRFHGGLLSRCGGNRNLLGRGHLRRRRDLDRSLLRRHSLDRGSLDRGSLDRGSLGRRLLDGGSLCRRLLRGRLLGRRSLLR